MLVRRLLEKTYGKVIGPGYVSANREKWRKIWRTRRRIWCEISNLKIFILSKKANGGAIF